MFIQTSIILSSLFTSALGHMAMCEPAPRYSNYGPNFPALPAGQSYDYNIKAPIATDGEVFQPLCKYSVPYDTPVATWTAGQTVPVSFQAGGAAHGGGHCQFSLSYDGGVTFVVIHDILRNCFFNSPSAGNAAEVLSYQIPLPAQLPSGRAIFSWSWVNASGNREYYHNCSDVEITGNSSSFSGPKMLVANYGPDYPVIPEFHGNYDTGLDLFDARPIVTVSGGGGYSTVSHKSTPPKKALSAKPASPAPAPAPVPVDSPAAAPVVASTNPEGSCISNQLRCCETTNALQVCNYGTWITIDCPATTVCKLNHGFPHCTWP